MERCRSVLDPIREVRELVPEPVRLWQHLFGIDLVVDIRQHVEHLAALRQDGVWAQTESDLPGEDLEVHSQEARRRIRRRGLNAHRHGLLEGVKFTAAVGNVGQAPKVENLARSEGADGDDDYIGEAHTAF